MTSLRKTHDRGHADPQSRSPRAEHVRSPGLNVCALFSKSPEARGPEEIRTYQVYLTSERRLATSSILIAISALRFLYRVTLRKDWTFEEIIPAPKKPQKLPIVLSPEEVIQFLNCIAGIKHRVILTTCYAAGLRISEAICLRPSAIDSKRMVLRVEQGKGQKDRYVMLSPKLLATLRDWWRVERLKHWLFQATSPASTSAKTRLSKRVRRRTASATFPNRSRLIL